MELETQSYLLVEIDRNGVGIKKENLIRYMKDHNFNYHFLNSPEDLVRHIRETMNLLSKPSITEASSTHSSIIEPIVKVATHQELLQSWANERFTVDSMEMNLLFGSDKNNQRLIIDENEPIVAKYVAKYQKQGIIKEVPPRFFKDASNRNIESDSKNNAVTNNNEKPGTTLMCETCNDTINVGRTRLTKLRRQAEHAMKFHVPDSVTFEICHRYRCMSCLQTIPVYKPPSDHIDYFHNDDTSVIITDLWTKAELKLFNQILSACFHRKLPIPRERKMYPIFRTNIVCRKTPYRILSQEEMNKNGIEKYESMPPSQSSDTPTGIMDFVEKDVEVENQVRH